MTTFGVRVQAATRAVGRNASAAGRIAIGAVFAWSGLLHVTGQHPQGHLASALFYGFQPAEAHHFVGAIEVATGIVLISGAFPRFGLLLLAVEAVGAVLVAWLTLGTLHRGEHPLMLSTAGVFLLQYAALAATGGALLAAQAWARGETLHPHGDEDDAASATAPASETAPGTAAHPVRREEAGGRPAVARHEPGLGTGPDSRAGDWVALMDDAATPPEGPQRSRGSRWIEL